MSIDTEKWAQEQLDILNGPEHAGVEITLGRGLVDVCHYRHDGKHGILLKPREEFVPVGGVNPDLPVNSEYWTSENDVVIWIDNKEGAQVLLDYVNIVLEKLK
jgi:hypothetical protein